MSKENISHESILDEFCLRIQEWVKGYVKSVFEQAGINGASIDFSHITGDPPTGLVSMSHNDLTSVSTDQHHAQSHHVAHENGGDDEIGVAGLSGVLADAQTPAAHAHTHASTTGQTIDDHHAKSHAHDGADGSGTVAHSATTGKTANDHHNQAHDLDGADHTGKDSLEATYILTGAGLIKCTPGNPPTGGLVVQVKNTTGAPTHTAEEGTPCWNSVDDELYVNNNGTTGWTKLGVSAAFATPAIVLGSAAAAGAAATVIRSDSTIAAFDATVPSTQAFGDAAAVGAVAFAARRDHKHAMMANPVDADELVVQAGLVTVVNSLAVGTSPAASGIIRIPNAQWIAARNAAGDADVNLIKLNASDKIEAAFPVFVPLQAPLTSTSWDGDAYSTTGATLIDLSAVFSAPAGIKAVLLAVTINDSGSAATADCNIAFAPVSTSAIFNNLHVACGGLANDAFARGQGIVSCDANGDIYYSIIASGAGTMDVRIRIWGYWQ